MKKRIISLLLCLCMTVCLLAGITVSVDAAGRLTLAELKAKFPSGRYWNGGNPDATTATPCNRHENTTGPNCNYFNGTQCNGFAKKLVYDYYGVIVPGSNSWPKASNLNSIKPGDIILYSGHVVWVTGVSGDNITIADCNYSWNCNIRWDFTMKKSAFKNVTNIWSAPFALTESQKKPSIPTIKEICIVGNTAMVSWESAEGASVYTVDFCAVNGTTFTHDYYDTNSTMMTKTLPFGTYAIRVGAKNNLGESGFTSFHYCDVLEKIPVTFDPNGGELEKTKARIPYNSINGERGLDHLVIYNNSGTKTGTNIYGAEVLVNANQEVTEVIDRIGNATVPVGGFVLSGNREAEYWLMDNVAVGDFVNFHPNEQSVWVWSKNGWMSYTKKATPGRSYGELPTPLPRSGYTFDGWYTAADGGNLVTDETIVPTGNAVTLFAHWSESTHTHTYAAVITTAPSCTKAGVKTYVCTCGDKYTEEIPATGHDWDSGVITSQPTADEPGEKTYTCQNDAAHTYAELISPTNAPTLTVTGGKAQPGKTVTVSLALANNPGIAGMRLNLAYDSALTLEKAETADALSDLTFTKPGNLSANPVTLFWDGMDADATNGTILNLTFTVADGTADGEYPITVTYTSGEIYDGSMQDVTLAIKNGIVTVKNYILGDANGDNLVNGKDVTILRQFLTGGYGVTINELAADANRDGAANGKDVTVLRRYLAGGYGVTLE